MHLIRNRAWRYSFESLFVYIISFLILSFPGLSHAEEVNSFQPTKFPYKNIQVQIMPEFDYPPEWSSEQPAILVGYYGTFVNQSGYDFNGEIEVKAPVKDENFQVHLVQEIPSGDQTEIPRQPIIDKENETIKWRPIGPIKAGEEYTFYVEYYYNPIKITDKKSFEYTFISEALTESSDIFFYLPVGARNFAINHEPMNISRSEYGEEVYQFHYEQLQAKERKFFTISYEKNDHISTLATINKTEAPNDANPEVVPEENASDKEIETKQENKKQQGILWVQGILMIVALFLVGAFIFKTFR